MWMKTKMTTWESPSSGGVSLNQSDKVSINAVKSVPAPPPPRPHSGRGGFVYHNLADLLLSSLSSLPLEEIENKTRSGRLKYGITQQYHDQILQGSFVSLIILTYESDCPLQHTLRPRQIKIIMRDHKKRANVCFASYLSRPSGQQSFSALYYSWPVA